MVFSKIFSAQPDLLRSAGIVVEADITNGLHSFSIIGLGDKSIAESRDRVSSAIKNSGFISPKSKNQKIIISLTPAHLKKTGTFFDVPIALAYLKSSKQIDFDSSDRLFIGELSLDGKIKRVSGIIQTILFAREFGYKEIYIPYENKIEASIIPGIKIFPAKDLEETIDHLQNKQEIRPLKHKKVRVEAKNNSLILDNIKGNDFAKRSVLIAACGGHNICFHGPPGTGKTLLSKSLSEILPPLEHKQILESSSIHSLFGTLVGLIVKPPFRNPHHTSSYSSIIGGGVDIKPGEITLAHNGVLFMDEFLEFDRRTIESLRQPIEDKEIKISRSAKHIVYPANFILVIALNPCPCGFKGTNIKECTCTTNEIANYNRKMSGPILDRIDLFTEVAKVEYEKLLLPNKKEIDYKKNVQRVREVQKKRWGKLNSDLSVSDLENILDDKELRQKFNRVAQKLNLSARAYHKILRISRTIADIEKSEKIKEPHLLEALQYRNKT